MSRGPCAKRLQETTNNRSTREETRETQDESDPPKARVHGRHLGRHHDWSRPGPRPAGLPVQGDHHHRARGRGRPDRRGRASVGESMGRTLGQQIVVENVGGAGGTIGMARVAKSAPDGYTLAVWHIAQATAPTLYDNLRYNVIDDFNSIGRITDVPMTIVGKSGLEAKNIARAAGLGEAEAGRRHLRPRRCRLGLIPVRAHVHEQRRHADDRGVVPRHRPRHDRSARRPVRHDVRPDHGHDQPDQARQDQGLCRHHAGAPRGASGLADARRGRVSRVSRLRPGTRCGRPRACPPRSPRS